MSDAIDATARLLRRRLADGDLWVPVDGPSMSPTLAPPATVLLRSSAAPRPGELWAATAPDGSIVVHRCLRRRRDGTYEFRGDAEAVDDAAVGPEHLIGRVVAARGADGPVRIGRRWRAVVASRWRGLRRLTARTLSRRS